MENASVRQMLWCGIGILLVLVKAGQTVLTEEGVPLSLPCPDMVLAPITRNNEGQFIYWFKPDGEPPSSENMIASFNVMEEFPTIFEPYQSRGFTLSPEGNVLYIPEVDLADDGTYTCWNSGTDTGVEGQNVTVLVRPDSISFRPDPLVVIEGQSVTVTGVIAHLNPLPARILWRVGNATSQRDIASTYRHESTGLLVVESNYDVTGDVTLQNQSLEVIVRLVNGELFSNHRILEIRAPDAMASSMNNSAATLTPILVVGLLLGLACVLVVLGYMLRKRCKRLELSCDWVQKQAFIAPFARLKKWCHKNTSEAGVDLRLPQRDVPDEMEFHNEAMEAEVEYNGISRQRSQTTVSGYEHAFCAKCAEGNHDTCPEHSPVYTDPEEVHGVPLEGMVSSQSVPQEPVYAEPKEDTHHIERAGDADGVYNGRVLMNADHGSETNQFENNVYNEIIDGYSRIDELSRNEKDRKDNHHGNHNGNETNHYDGDSGVYRIDTRENIYDEPKEAGSHQSHLYHEPLEVKDDILYDEALEVRHQESGQQMSLYYSQATRNLPQPGPVDLTHDYLETLPEDHYANRYRDDPYYSQPKDVPQYKNLQGVTDTLTYA